jgi:hypothetical protein
MSISTAVRTTHWLTDERIRVYSGILLVTFAIAYVALTAMSLPALVDPRGKPVGYDFITFWSAARLALQGRPDAAFDWQAIGAAQQAAVPAMTGKLFLWHYPPTFLLAVLPLGFLPYIVAFAAFTLGSMAIWAALVRRMVADRRYWVVAAAMPAGLINFFHGQNGFLTAALGGFALLLLDEQPIVAGILIGLLAIKPHLAVLFPIALIAAGKWRAVAAAAVTATLFGAVSVLAFGPATMLAFVHDIPGAGRLVDLGILPWGMMPSPYVFALALGAPPTAAMALQGLIAIAAAACVWLVWRRRTAPLPAKAATLLVGSLLVSPYVFYYDMTWAGLAVGWLALAQATAGSFRGEREVLIAGWVVPLLMVPIYTVTGVQIGAVVLMLLFAVAIRRATAAPSSSAR